MTGFAIFILGYQPNAKHVCNISQLHNSRDPDLTVLIRRKMATQLSDGNDNELKSNFIAQSYFQSK